MEWPVLHAEVAALVVGVVTAGSLAAEGVGGVLLAVRVTHALVELPSRISSFGRLEIELVLTLVNFLNNPEVLLVWFSFLLAVMPRRFDQKIFQIGTTVKAA
jgi:hypothetical protein